MCKYIYCPYVQIQRFKNILQLTALATVALAEPEADAHYGYGGYGGYYGHGLYGYGYGHQLQWPSYSAPGFTSTVWGARGKRSAEPSAEPHGYGFYGYHPYAYGLYHPYAYGHHVAHVAAPAIAAPALPALPAAAAGVGGHPGGATSYSHRSPQGLRGKRSAEEAAPAEDDKVYGTGHNSYVGQTVWGFPKVKRSAEEVEAVAEEAAAPAVAHPYYGGYYGHQLGWASFRAPGFESTLWGGRLGKRSAEAEPEADAYYGYGGYYGHQLQWPGVRAPGFSSQCFGCRGKRSAEAEAEPGYGYGYGYYGYPAYRGYYGHPYLGGVAGHPTGTSYSHRSVQGLGGK